MQQPESMCRLLTMAFMGPKMGGRLVSYESGSQGWLFIAWDGLLDNRTFNPSKPYKWKQSEHAMGDWYGLPTFIKHFARLWYMSLQAHPINCSLLMTSLLWVTELHFPMYSLYLFWANDGLVKYRLMDEAWFQRADSYQSQEESAVQWLTVLV